MSAGEPAPQPIRLADRHAPGGDAMKRRWVVQREGGEERIEADEVEITHSGALVFYKFASRMEKERTLLTAFSPDLWRRCQLEIDA
jgi:hypothetical protein